MSATIKFDTDDFNRKVEEVRRMIGRNGRSYVRTTARRLVRRMAWNAPRAPKQYRASGRLRAGFWPAAIALNISNIYTPFQNKGEGGAEDNTNSSSPSFTIINAVPYIGSLKAGLEWVEEAKRGVEAQMARDLRKYCEDSWSRRDLIDDLTAE